MSIYKKHPLCVAALLLLTAKAAFALPFSTEEPLRVVSPCAKIGEPFTIVVPVSVPSGITVHYQWYRNGVPLTADEEILSAGEQELSYPIPAAAADGTNEQFYFVYRLEGADNDICCTPSPVYLISFTASWDPGCVTSGGVVAGMPLDLCTHASGGNIRGAPSSLCVAWAGGTVLGTPANLCTNVSGGMVQGSLVNLCAAANGGKVQGTPVTLCAAANGGTIQGSDLARLPQYNFDPVCIMNITGGVVAASPLNLCGDNNGGEIRGSTVALCTTDKGGAIHGSVVNLCNADNGGAIRGSTVNLCNANQGGNIRGSAINLCNANQGGSIGF